MILHALGLLAGLALLTLGADALVRGAAALATALGVSALVVGLTIVALGTSLPELLVSLLAALRDQADISVGNVVGSNIFNVTLIVGASALIRPIAIQRTLIRREIPIMLGVSLALVAILLDVTIAHWEGLLLLGGFVAYVGTTILRSNGRDERPDAEEEAPSREGRRLGGELGRILVGLVALGLGARLLVDSAVGIGRLLELSDRLIGLTIVAAGTSLPELATSVAAGLQRQSDIAIGNIVGSNVFNILGILGVSAIVRPLYAQASLLTVDVPVMVGSALLLMFVCRTGHVLRRLEGAVLLAAYVAYVSGIVAWAS